MIQMFSTSSDMGYLRSVNNLNMFEYNIPLYSPKIGSWKVLAALTGDEHLNLKNCME